MQPQVRATAIYTSNAAFAMSGVPFVPIIDVADDGALNTPTPLTQPSQAIAAFPGPLGKKAAKCIASKKLPVLAVRASATVLSAFSAVGRSTGHGASVVTVHSGSTTSINAVVKVLVVVGGTVGQASPAITYQVSTDDGLSYGVVTGLGTDVDLDITLGTGTLTLDFTAASLVAGEVITVTANYVNEGSYGTLNTSLYPGGANTAAASVDATYYPNDDYEIKIEFLQGGTLGTAGILYRYSRTNGREDTNWSQSTALGTALYIIVPGTGVSGLANSGAKIILGTAAQTIGTGSSLYVRTYAPTFTLSTMQDALNALFLNRQSWERVIMGCPITSHAVGQAIDDIFAANYATTIHGEKSWIGSFRIPNDGESKATYMAAGQTFSGLGRTFYFGSMCFGDCKAVDAITGDFARVAIAPIVGFELASVKPDIDIAATTRPGLGVQLADDNGNPDCYDDSLYAGTMDDYGFLTLRGDQPEGIFVNNPRMFVPLGVNIPMTYHRDLLNLHTRIARDVGRTLLSHGFDANKTTGYITEADAKDAEKRFNDAENDALVKPNYLSNQNISVSRTDNMNAVTPTLTVSGQLQTKLYPKLIDYTDQIVATITNAG